MIWCTFLAVQYALAAHSRIASLVCDNPECSEENQRIAAPSAIICAAADAFASCYRVALLLRRTMLAGILVARTRRKKLQSAQCTVALHAKLKISCKKVLSRPCGPIRRCAKTSDPSSPTRCVHSDFGGALFDFAVYAVIVSVKSCSFKILEVKAACGLHISRNSAIITPFVFHSDEDSSNKFFFVI
jgi:hypothetical protein